MVDGDMNDLEHQWLQCAARMAAAGKAAAEPLYGTSSGRARLGRGAGGDETLELDRACEQAIAGVLAAEAPCPYQLVSEEAGVTGLDGAGWRVVLDPLDGSLNAKRGLETFGVSIAVAEGDRLDDVRVAYIEDYTRPRSYAAIRGVGLLSAGGAPGRRDAGTGGAGRETALLDSSRFASDLVEIVLLEAGRPDRHHFEYHDLSAMGAMGRSRDMRVRQLGSLALSLCYVAIGAADILVAAVSSRSVDIAAGLLILREAGGGAAAFCEQDLWAQPLDLRKRSAFVAWRAGLDSAEIISRSSELGHTLLAATAP